MDGLQYTPHDGIGTAVRKYQMVSTPLTLIVEV
jgi:hypothetical protein